MRYYKEIFLATSLILATEDGYSATCPSSSCYVSDPSRYGCEIGEVFGVKACSNGGEDGISDGEYQCVEYIARFYELSYATGSGAAVCDNLSTKDQDNDGITDFEWHGNDASTSKPEPGDVICFLQTYGGVGHTAIVKEADDNHVTIVDQNRSKINGELLLDARWNDNKTFHIEGLNHQGTFPTTAWAHPLDIALPVSAPPTTTTQTICTSTPTSFEYLMASIEGSGNQNVTMWRKEGDDVTSGFVAYGPVRDGFGSDKTKNWMFGNVTGDGYADIVTSIVDGNNRVVEVFPATGDGGLYDPKAWYTESEEKVDKLLIADVNGDALDDLIIGDANSSDDYRWKTCINIGSTFTNCTNWNNTSDDKNTFGQKGDIILMADMDGDGRSELLRGRLQDAQTCNGTKKHKWNRLNINGTSETIADCWGLEAVDFLVGDVDNDHKDELVNIRSTDSSVEVFVGDYDTTKHQLINTDTRRAKDVGGADGVYALSDIDLDGFPDIIWWSASGKLSWMRNQRNSTFDDQSHGITLITNLAREDNNQILFASQHFGMYEKKECHEEVMTITTSSSSISSTSSTYASLSSAILWRNEITGELGIWRMNGTLYLQSLVLPTSDPQWDIVGVADLNTDGQTDILWQHRQIPYELSCWIMNGTNIQESRNIAMSTDPVWAIQGVADFTRDGSSDILWKKFSDGALSIWEMYDTVILSTSIIVGSTDTQWSIVAVADFTRDGSPDIMWRNSISGELSLWVMTGIGIQSNFSLAASTDTRWNIVATTDFTHDNMQDILWRNSQSGELSLWEMNQILYVQSLPLIPSDPTWEIRGMMIGIDAY